MPKNEFSTSVASPMFRIVAVMVLFLSVTVCGLQVLAALSTSDHPDPAVPAIPWTAMLVTPLLTLIAGIGLAAVLEGIARLVGAQQHVEEVEDHSAAIVKTLASISKLQNSLPELIGDAIKEASTAAPATMEISNVGPIDLGIEQHLQRMVTLMEEMKEVSMLDESQRKVRRQQASQRRKSTRLEEATQLIDGGNWEQADALLHLLESLHPGDAEVLACRNHLDDSRILHQADGWDQLRPQVEELLSQSRYSDAGELTAQFLDRFPNHPDCRQLADRVKQEEQLQIESNSARLYDEIKIAVESRQWRKALDGIQHFLQAYPDHARAAKIRQQVRVIQKNAEIEERHEQEERIRELITSRRYADAADLSEDLLARFPDSPQASYLTELLPKLRERSNLETQTA